MNSLNPFKQWLAKGARIPFGTWLMSAAPATAEALGHCGFDFLVVDMEHVPIETPDLVNILRAVAVTPAQPLVRIAANDAIIVKKVMDAGARTLMFPFIQTAAEAAAAVRATRYPPDGIRGVAAVHRGSHYGRIPDYFKQANATTAVIIQLETPEAIERMAEIAAVPGVDALFVGPGDLSAAMGRIGEISHPEVQALIEHAARMARDLGKPIGIVGPNPAMVARFLGYGYDFVAVASDMGMMTGRAVEWLAEIRGGQAAPAAEAAY